MVRDLAVPNIVFLFFYLVATLCIHTVEIDVRLEGSCGLLLTVESPQGSRSVRIVCLSCCIHGLLL